MKIYILEVSYDGAIVAVAENEEQARGFMRAELERVNLLPSRANGPLEQLDIKPGALHFTKGEDGS